jgi:hypothetical protein
MADKAKNNDINLDEQLEARQNLFGFFRLLYEVDRRTNPQLYKRPKKDKKQDS